MQFECFRYAYLAPEYSIKYSSKISVLIHKSFHWLMVTYYLTNENILFKTVHNYFKNFARDYHFQSWKLLSFGKSLL